MHNKELDTSGIQFRLKLCDISRLESLNKLCINICSYDAESYIISIRISEKPVIAYDRIIVLLYVVNNEETHYCLITNLSRLCHKQRSTHNEVHFICRRSLHFFQTKEKFNIHSELCVLHDSQKTVSPKKESGDDKIYFKAVEHQLPPPFLLFR